MRRRNQAVIAVAVTAMVMPASGCTDKAESKAGGSSPPITLQVGTNDEPGAPAARAIDEFARQVQARSHGQLTVQPVWEASDGNQGVGWDQAVARRVASGDLEMGMIPARAWDTEKVTSLRALQAPFLVNTEGLAKQVVTADLAGKMLAGLDQIGITGLSLVPESTRLIFSFGKPMLSPADMRGAVVRVPRSDTTYAMFRAFGAAPDDAEAVQGRTAGAESSFELVPRVGRQMATATGNVVPYAKINSLVINSKRFAALTEAQRSMVREAATATRDWGVKSMPGTADQATWYCKQQGGSVVLATPANVAAFQRAARPVYAELEKDAETAAFIAGIRDLASRVQPAPPVKACGPSAAVTTSSQPAVGAFPDGTYRKEASEQVMLAGGVTGRNAKDHAGLWTMTFHKGTFTIQQRGYPVGPGVYCVAADKVTVAEGRSRCGGIDGMTLFTATWRLDGDLLRFGVTAGDDNAPPGALTKTLFGGEPWTRIAR
ncbi:hypothetical protein AB0M20_11415 [Actinoplanes sp. NPDC051633]|uniref:TRAP transporter substrate-binding protein n=1 Tax=Actinoplanes sp. NPDC051633 TaxID=3155670 RepID=UPI0034355A19